MGEYPAIRTRSSPPYSLATHRARSLRKGTPRYRFVETAFITLMPLVSLTVVFTPIVLFGSDLTAVVILPALLVNILGSGTDLNTAWKMWSLPDGALLQHDYDENIAYYVPSH